VNCTGTAVALASQVQNPVAQLPVDNNGVLVQLPGVAPGGISSDIGQLMLADSLPDEFEKALALSRKEKIPLPRAELEIFGGTHTGLAAYLFGLWGLPAAIVEAVAFNHTPEKSDLKKFSALTAVHVANALCDESEAENLDLNYLARIGVADRLDDWRGIAAELQMESAGQTK
jgi:HD-like signal output (HDOD) protein